MNNNDYEDLIEKRLSDYRFHHSVCVAKKTIELAKKHGLDEEKAYVAGILHDITKEEPLDVQKELIEANGYKMTELEINSPNIYHQMSGAEYIRNVLNIDDEDIIGGVRYHTTGRADMTDFEMMIYLADFTSDDRNYPDVDIMRQKTEKSFLDGMLYSLKYTITKLTQQEKQIHPDTLHCYNWVVEQIKKKVKVYE